MKLIQGVRIFINYQIPLLVESQLHPQANFRKYSVCRYQNENSTPGRYRISDNNRLISSSDFRLSVN